MHLREILRELDIPYKTEGEHHHARSGWCQVECPYCSANTQRFRMGIAENSWAVSCYACGIHKLTETLVLLSGEPWHKVISLLNGRENLFRAERAPQGRLILPDGLRPLHRLHRSYLRGRGFDPDELVKLWGLQCTCLSTRWPWRIFIPIIHKGETVSWTTRSLAKYGARYVNASSSCEKTSMKSLLYGSDYAHHAVIVVEGPIDVWKIGPGAVATMGVKFTQEQVAKISRYPNRWICFDNEEAAQQQARKLMWELSVFPGTTTNIVLESGKDPGEASRGELKQLRTLAFDDNAVYQ